MATQVWKRIRETWLSHKPSPIAGIVAAISVLLLVIGAVAYLQNFLNAQEWMPASRDLVFAKHQWWRLWTTLFAHADTGHLLSNLFLFFVMGYFLNGYFGIFVFPVAAFFLGGLTNLLVLLTYPPEIKLIGASGIVYWLGGAWLGLYFLIDLKRTYFQRFLRAGGVALGIFWPATTFDPNISYGAHLIGFLIGLVFGLLYYAYKKDLFKSAIVYEWVVDEDPEDGLSDPEFHI